jgi:iron complex transport system substrate-binding protein
MSLRFVCWVLSLIPLVASAQTLPKVASINLCADQLVLRLAAPAQILTVSWLAADPEESMLADEARRYPPNFGSAEEILRLRPDVVIAGVYTNAFTRGLLRRLGYNVVDISPAEDIDAIERNLRQVGGAIDRADRAEDLIDQMRASVAALEASRPSDLVSAIVVRPGGFTVGAGTLSDALLRLAGLRNAAAEQGLDRWGSLSMEAVLRAAPALLVMTGYRAHEQSLANLVFEHPALQRVGDRTLRTTVAGKYWSCGMPDSLHSVEILRGALRDRP